MKLVTLQTSFILTRRAKGLPAAFTERGTRWERWSSALTPAYWEPGAGDDGSQRSRVGSSAVPRYKVQFRTEPRLTDEARNALEAAGIQLVNGQSGVSHDAPGGNLPEVSTHSVWVDADGEDAAGRALTEALEDKTVAFELLGVEPLESD